MNRIPNTTRAIWRFLLLDHGPQLHRAAAALARSAVLVFCLGATLRLLLQQLIGRGRCLLQGQRYPVAPGLEGHRQQGPGRAGKSTLVFPIVLDLHPGIPFGGDIRDLDHFNEGSGTGRRKVAEQHGTDLEEWAPPTDA